MSANTCKDCGRFNFCNELNLHAKENGLCKHTTIAPFAHGFSDGSEYRGIHLEQFEADDECWQEMFLDMEQAEWLAKHLPTAIQQAKEKIPT